MRKILWLLLQFPAAALLCSCQRPSIADKPTQHYDIDSARLEAYFSWRDSIEVIGFFDNNDAKFLENNELERDSVLLNRFLDQQFSFFTNNGDLPYEQEQLLQYLHPFQLDGDSLTDIIFEGPTGGEQTVVHVFLNRDTGFINILTTYQKVTLMQFRDNILEKLYITDPGCCAEPEVYDHIYKSYIKNNNLALKLESSIAYIVGTQTMQKKFTKAQPVKLKNKAKLRCDTYLFDSVEHPVWGSEGNIIAVYNAGSRGLAFGSRINGQSEWLYVKIHSTHAPVGGYFYQYMDEPASIYGWIRKEDVIMAEK